MRGYRLSADDRIRRAVIGRLLCHTVIPKHEIEREFSISFDEYFAAELARLEEPRADGLVILDSRRNSRYAARAHLHPQRGHGLRPLSRRTADGSEASVFENAVTDHVANGRSNITGRRHRRGHFRARVRLSAFQQLGVPVTLLEAVEHARAGLIGTVETGRISFRIRPQSFQGTDSLLDLIREVGIEDELCEADPRAPRYVLRQRQAAENSDVAAGDARQFPARRRARGGRSLRSALRRTQPPAKKNPSPISCGANSDMKFWNTWLRRSFPASMRAIRKS